MQRLEVVARLQWLIEQQFGIRGENIVDKSLSATAFAPKFTSERSGLRSIIQRTAINKRMSSERQALVDSGFLRVDPANQCELWRVSLRAAAFSDVDFGNFTRKLQNISQPLFDACYIQARIEQTLAERTELGIENGKRVLLWGHSDDQETRTHLQRVFGLLDEQLKKIGLEVVVVSESPAQTPIFNIDSMGNFDAVLASGDISDNDFQLIRSVVPNIIDGRVRTIESNGTNSLSLGSSTHPITGVFTGIVPIVYQAQRMLLSSLTDSTLYSFLTITPIMMIVSRSFIGGCVAMIPNLLPILLVFGGMGWLGIAIDIGSLMTASIALGVAVDDTIHFLARYCEELEHRYDVREAIVEAYCHCAIPTLQAALVSGLGLSVFAFSTFAPTQRFGWLMLSILFAGVVAELVLLPAILASPLGKFFVVRSKKWLGVKTKLVEYRDGPLTVCSTSKTL